MSTPQFVDISQFNPEQIDWQAYKAWSAQGDGISRVAMRSSYGVGYTDQHFSAYRAGALAAGIDSILYYHYSYPQYNSAAAEANWQHQVVGDVRPQDLFVLDFEENVSQATADWAYQWLAQQEANYSGKLPALYASDAYIRARLQDSRLARYGLWLADWQYSPDERPACPSPWSMYAFVQYSDRQTNIPGIAGQIDADIFLGGNTVGITINSPSVGDYFIEQASDIWSCKQNNLVIGHAILDFYKAYGGNGLCGLTYLGLPLTNETSLPAGGVSQKFERGIVAYDPDRKTDNPPGSSGFCYLMHVDGSAPADAQTIADLKNRLAQIEQLAKV